VYTRRIREEANMMGKDITFKCPNCDYNRNVELGVTQFVNIKGKGEELATVICPECGHSIAFEMQEFGCYRQYLGDMNVVAIIEQIVNNMGEAEILDEEKCIRSILNKVRAHMGDEYAEKYHVELISIAEIKICNKTKPIISIDLETVPKEDIKYTNVVCY